MLVLEFLLISSGVVTLFAHSISKRHLPDTGPDPDMRPIDRFQTTTKDWFSHHNHHEFPVDENKETWHYDYEDDYMVPTTIAIPYETEGTTDFISDYIEFHDVISTAFPDGENEKFKSDGGLLSSWSWMIYVIAILIVFV